MRAVGLMTFFRAFHASPNSGLYLGAEATELGRIGVVIGVVTSNWTQKSSINYLA